MRPLVLTAVQYEVETGYDFVRVDGTAFRGERGPSEVKMDTDSELVWTSDGSGSGAGFKVCASLDVKVTTTAQTASRRPAVTGSCKQASAAMTATPTTPTPA